MPVTYQIDKAKGIIRTRCAGNVSLKEVLDHFRQLEQDPDCPDRLDVLLDVCDQLTVPKKDELHEVTAAVYGVRGRVQFGMLAIVACTDVMFGMLRMWEVFAERYFGKTCVFRSVSEAEAWLIAERPSTLAAG
jgi:hypothetical protein